MKVNPKVLKAMEAQARVEEGIMEDIKGDGEVGFRDDMDVINRSKDYGGEFYPDDQYKYKKFRIEPEARNNFSGIIDKDITLGNYGGKTPDYREHSMIAETIVMIDNILVEDKQYVEVDEEGNPIMVTGLVDGVEASVPKVVTKRVFDEHFLPIRQALLSGLKFEVVASRAIGDRREAVLDKTTTVSRDIIKRGETKKQNLMGLGG